MLFYFDSPGKYGFWMKDMKFDIDIIWIDMDQKVVGMAENVAVNSYPKIFYPPSDVKYVLEVPSGFTVEHNIKIGDIFSPTF